MRLFVGILLSVLASAIFAQTASARVIVREKVKYYNISGKNGAALFRSIRKRGPRGTTTRHAIATTKISMKMKNVKTAIRGRRCVVKRADMVVTLTYLYPRWTNQRGASRRLRSTWKKFAARVIRHEKRHGDIAKKYARQLERTFRRLKGSVRKGCADFGRNSMRKFVSLTQRHAREHERFDRREGRSFSRVRRLEKALYAGQ